MTHHTQEVKDQFLTRWEGQTVTVWRPAHVQAGMGKVSFCDLQDKSGRIQIYARKDEMDEDAYNRLRSTTSAISSAWRARCSAPEGRDERRRPRTITLLSKSLLPLPDKFHGLPGQGTCATASGMWTSS